MTMAVKINACGIGSATVAPLVMPLLLGGFGFYGAIFLSEYLNIDFNLAWVPLAILCGLLVWWLNYRGIGLSTRTGLVLGIIEIAIFVLISLLLIVNAGGRNTLSVFVPGADGVKPAFQGMIFCLLAFIGFEAAAPLGEETRDPRRTIPRAVIWSAIVVGLFYVFNYYAGAPERFLEEVRMLHEESPDHVVLVSQRDS